MSPTRRGRRTCALVMLLGGALVAWAPAARAGDSKAQAPRQGETGRPAGHKRPGAEARPAEAKQKQQENQRPDDVTGLPPRRTGPVGG